MSPMFRQAALEKLSSPERLDSLMQVTTTKGWIALIGLIAVIAGAGVWGVLGSAPDNVSGFGILLRQGGIFNIEASGSGIIEQLLVAPDDAVQVGDVVARLSLPELDQQIRQTQTLIAELDDNRTRETALINQNRDLGRSRFGRRSPACSRKRRPSRSRSNTSPSGSKRNALPSSSV